MKRVWVYLLIFVVGIAVYSLAANLTSLLGISFPFLSYFPFIVVVFAISVIWVRHDFRRDTGWLVALQNQIATSEQEAYLKELLEKRSQGDRSLSNTVSISLACRYLERGEEAEWYGRQACADVENADLLRRKDMRTGLLRDLAYVALNDAWFIQGKFAEAAHLLNSYIPYAFQRNHITAITAWGYFLAGDEDHAREVVAQIKPSSRFRNKLIISKDRQLIVAYLQGALLHQDKRAALQQLDEQMQSWSGELMQNRKLFAYFARLDEVLAQICQQLPMGWYHREAQLLVTGRFDELLAQTRAKREQGDTSYQNTLSLAAAYTYQGSGGEAEPLAREALAAVQAGGWFQKKGWAARTLCDHAALGVYDALTMQCRFDEAARFLQPRIAHADKPNFFTLFTAQALFLAGDLDGARKLTAQLKPVAAHPKRYLTPRYQLLAAYLQYKLLGQDTRERMRKLHAQIARWDEELARYPADHAYGARLRPMVEEIRSLIQP